MFVFYVYSIFSRNVSCILLTTSDYHTWKICLFRRKKIPSLFIVFCRVCIIYFSRRRYTKSVAVRFLGRYYFFLFILCDKNRIYLCDYTVLSCAFYSIRKNTGHNSNNVYYRTVQSEWPKYNQKQINVYFGLTTTTLISILTTLVLIIQKWRSLCIQYMDSLLIHSYDSVTNCN